MVQPLLEKEKLDENCIWIIKFLILMHTVETDGIEKKGEGLKTQHKKSLSYTMHRKAGARKKFIKITNGGNWAQVSFKEAQRRKLRCLTRQLSN